jgi:hypothetical protein
MIYHMKGQNSLNDQYFEQRDKGWTEESIPEMSMYLPENEDIEDLHCEPFQEPRLCYDFPSIHSQYPFSPDRESVDGFLYQVRFKYVGKYYLLGSVAMEGNLPIDYSLPLIKNGDYVCVEADRGLDIGVVTTKVALDGFRDSRLTMGRSRVHFGEYKHILRVATQNELQDYSKKLQDEANAVEVRSLSSLFSLIVLGLQK